MNKNWTYQSKNLYSINRPTWQPVVHSNAAEIEKEIRRTEMVEKIGFGIYWMLCPLIGFGLLILLLSFL